MLLNIHTCEWDEDLLKLFDIPASVLPEVRPSSKTYGVTRSDRGRCQYTKCQVLPADQQAALFGQMCTQPRHGEEHLW